MDGSQIRFGDHVWVLHPGKTLTFGRSGDCDVTLPDDQHLSRRAGTLIGHKGYLEIRNDSSSRALLVRPPFGEDRVVEPRSATTSLPLRRFDVVLHGHGGALVVLAVDTGTDVFQPSVTTGPGGTLTSPVELSDTQRRILLALCEPLLTRRGVAARPATYAEIARRLDLSQGYVRNVIKVLRETLTGYGVPGLSQYDADSAGDDFRRTLAQWALRGGWVTAEQLDELP